MNFLNLLTLIFITLKLTGYITWSWWLVLSPTIFLFIIGAVFGVTRELSMTPRQRALRDFNKR